MAISARQDFLGKSKENRKAAIKGGNILFIQLFYKIINIR